MKRQIVQSVVVAATVVLIGGGTVLAKDITCSGGECNGTRTADEIAGSTSPDIIFGKGGDDWITQPDKLSDGELQSTQRTRWPFHKQFARLGSPRLKTGDAGIARIAWSVALSHAATTPRICITSGSSARSASWASQLSTRCISTVGGPITVCGYALTSGVSAYNCLSVAASAASSCAAG